MGHSAPSAEKSERRPGHSGRPPWHATLTRLSRLLPDPAPHARGSGRTRATARRPVVDAQPSNSLRWVDEPKLIVCHYLKGWFVLDIISILPFDLASLKDPDEDPDAESSSSDLSVLKLVRIIRLLRLIKLVRLVRGARILKRWESKLAINYSTLTLWQSQLGQKCPSSQHPMRPPTALQRPTHLLRAAPLGPERRALTAWMRKRTCFMACALAPAQSCRFTGFRPSRQCLVGLLLSAHWFACIWAMQVAGPSTHRVMHAAAPSMHRVMHAATLPRFHAHARGTSAAAQRTQPASVAVCVCLPPVSSCAQVSLAHETPVDSWMGWYGYCWDLGKSPDTSLERVVVDGPGVAEFECAAPGSRYSASVYFAVMTITSIGYGDITPRPQLASEQIMATLLMLVASMLWAYIIGTFCGMIATMNPAQANFRNTIDDLNRFMELQAFFRQP